MHTHTHARTAMRFHRTRRRRRASARMLGLLPLAASALLLLLMLGATPAVASIGPDSDPDSSPCAVAEAEIAILKAQVQQLKAALNWTQQVPSSMAAEFEAAWAAAQAGLAPPDDAGGYEVIAICPDTPAVQISRLPDSVRAAGICSSFRMRSTSGDFDSSIEIACNADTWAD